MILTEIIQPIPNSPGVEGHGQGVVYENKSLAHYSKDMGTRMLKDNNVKYGARPFTVREWARLQGFLTIGRLMN